MFFNAFEIHAIHDQATARGPDNAGVCSSVREMVVALFLLLQELWVL